MFSTESDAFEWTKALPKCELHAHLSGSLRDSFLKSLLERERSAHLRARADVLLDKVRSLDECFELFKLLHALIDDADTLRRCVHHVLEDFDSDNVVYLELRTTPRAAFGLEPRGYVDIVLNSIAEYHAEHPNGLVCRLLLSVDRSRPVEDAERTLRIARDILMGGGPHSALLVGLELSGNPNKGRWVDFRHLFDIARRDLGLPVALHFAEVAGMDDEALDMLAFRPNRLGHAAVLSDNVKKRLLASDIPVEACITSNIRTRTCPAISDHVAITTLVPNMHPFALCTDDSGVFGTSCSRELALLAGELKFTRDECVEKAIGALNFAFCSDSKIMDAVRERARKMVILLKGV